MTNIEATPGDRQRAFVLTAHFLTRDGAGLGATQIEAREAKRTPQLFLAVLGTLEAVVAAYLTPAGLSALEAALEATKAHSDDPAVARAVEAILGNKAGDRDRIVAAMREAKSDDDEAGLLGLFYAVMGAYADLVPILRTPPVIEALRAAALEIAADEDPNPGKEL